MKGTEKKLIGPLIVIGIVVAALVGAAMTWRQYSGDRPSAVRAHVVGPARVLAAFPPEDASRIPVGAKGIVSWNGRRSTAFVTALNPAAAVPVELVLLEPFGDAAVGAACQVTVDLSLPPEYLKQPSPAQ
jgi:hypothetical protein